MLMHMNVDVMMLVNREPLLNISDTARAGRSIPINAFYPWFVVRYDELIILDIPEPSSGFLAFASLQALPKNLYMLAPLDLWSSRA